MVHFRKCHGFHDSIIGQRSVGNFMTTISNPKIKPRFHDYHRDHLFNFLLYISSLLVFLAHLTRRVMWAIAITLRQSSVVRRKLFKKSSPLKVLDQGKPNLVRIITRVSSFKIVSGDAVYQPTNMAVVTKNRTYGKIAGFG